MQQIDETEYMATLKKLIEAKRKLIKEKKPHQIKV